MARHASLRASDADREQVTERLRAAAAEGRLLAHELEQRLATALRARTYGELDAVVSDLPSGALERRRRPFLAPIAVAVIAVAALIVIALAVAFVITGIAIWLTWVAIAWCFFGRRRMTCARRRRGWELRAANRRLL